MVLSVDVEHTSKSASEKVRRAQRRRLEDSGDVGFAVAVELAPSDRGGLTASAFEPEWRQDGSLSWGFSAAHARAQNSGTDPYTPPLEPLLRWGDRVFNPPVSADEILQELDEQGWHPGIFRHPGAAVWSKIRSEGIKPKHFATEGMARQEQWLRQNSLGKYLDRELR